MRIIIIIIVIIVIISLLSPCVLFFNAAGVDTHTNTIQENISQEKQGL
jgi:hypothetical protein